MWLGNAGGLYGAGSNIPPQQHSSLAQEASAAIRRLDASGNASPSGAVVLLSLGMSNATQEFREFIRLAGSDPSLAQGLVIVDGAQGGQTASVIRNPDAPFWANVDERLRVAGVTAAQVQVIWLKEANARPSGDPAEHARALSGDLAEIARVARDRYANTRLLFASSRIYAGYASTPLNPEPYAYASGFAVQWLIEAQVEGDASLNADPARGAVEAPVLLWGPYLWADGLTPRADGLVWTCGDLADDGTHPSPSGQRKVAAMLLEHFKSDRYSAGWFTSAGAPTPDPTTAPTASSTPFERPTSTPTPREPTPRATVSSGSALLPSALRP
jgi:hypothetical protein